MPNGDDKNFRRLLMACAAYRQRFGAWPSRAQLSPPILQNLAGLFDAPSFERLAGLLELVTDTTTPAAFGVAGDEGVLDYRDVQHGALGTALAEAERWLGVEPLRH